MSVRREPRSYPRAISIRRTPARFSPIQGPCRSLPTSLSWNPGAALRTTVLQARFQQRLHAGLAALVSYTFGKSLDENSTFFSSAGDANFPQNSANPGAEKGRSNFDLRHRFSLGYSYDLPIGRGGRLVAGHSFVSALLAGWSTHGIVTLQSGRPFTVALLPEIDNSNTGIASLGFGANDRPNRIASGELQNPGPEKWFDTGAFVFANYGSFGNSGRNILDGPGYQGCKRVSDQRLPHSRRLQPSIPRRIFQCAQPHQF